MGTENLMGGSPKKGGEESKGTAVVEDAFQVQINEILSKIDTDILAKLKEKRDELLEQIGKLEDVLDKVNSGITNFEDGLSSLKDGLNELNEVL